MKLIVQIPCLNEAESIAEVVQAIPRKIDGVDSVEVLIIDDGSSDGTAEIALRAGADHVLKNIKTLGLARSFQKGLDTCLALGADIIVNTDGDHQYPSELIPDLLVPILDGKADIVVGDRNPGENPDFSFHKRQLQKLGTWVVRRVSGVDVTDAVSGFRAYSRSAAQRTHVFTSFSYTTETLISAGRQGMQVASVPVATNFVSRPSRLASTLWRFLSRQVVSILRSYVMYNPLRAFAIIGLVFLALGLAPIVRFVWYFFAGEGQGHIQSLVIGSMFFTLGYFTLIIAVLSDTIATNRQLLEMTLDKLHRLDSNGTTRNND